MQTQGLSVFVITILLILEKYISKLVIKGGEDFNEDVKQNKTSAFKNRKYYETLSSEEKNISIFRILYWIESTLSS